MAKVRILSGSEPATLIEKNITANGTYNASADNADGYSSVNVNVSPILISKTITENGTYTAHSEPGEPDGYSAVSVNVPTGAEGVIVGSGEPLPSQGNDGDYYYKRSHVGHTGGSGWNTNGGSGQNIGGMKFTPTDDITISAIRSFSRNSSNITGKVGIYDSSGTPIYERDGVTIAPGWNTIYIPPVELSSNNVYFAVSTYYVGSSMIYSPISGMAFNSKLSAVSGIYGGIPGNTDSSNIYSTDIVIEDESLPLYIDSQYVKQNGTWVEIPSGII